MTRSIICKQPEELKSVAEALLKAYPDERVFAFYGKMGAGKTTFIQSLCKFLGAFDNVTSPTFSIINEYLTASGESLFHFDFYRIRKIEEVFDIGYEDYIYSGDYCFIEWPEKIEELLPENFVYVQIEETGEDGERRFTF